MAVAVVGAIVCGEATLQAQVAAAGATTSPLSILQQAPRVRLEDGPPSAMPPGATPSLMTPAPYSGATTVRPPAPPTEPEAEPDEETDQVEPRERRPGRVKGIIRAIPFIGKRIAGSEEEPEQQEPAQRDAEEEVGRPSSGKRPARVPEPPPGSGRDIPRPTFVYPPVPRETPDSVPLYPSDPTPSLPPAASGTPAPIEVTPGTAPMLSVRPARPLAPTTATLGAAVGSVSTPIVRKQPALAAADTTSVVNLDEAPAPADADISTPAPAAPPAAVSTPPTAPVASVAQTSPTLQPNDLGLPNPAYEQNDAIRAEYTEAVKVGRAGNYAEAARLFREYAENHPSSGLAPRAFFLASILEPDATRAAEAANLLRERFATSRYVKELEKRNAGKPVVEATPTPDPNEPPAQAAMRLENELTQAVGKPEREVPLRLRLGQVYMGLEEYERALEVMRPARDMAAGRPEEPEILVLISECLIATRRTEPAAALLGEMVQKFPDAPQRPRAQYDLGLVSEASGNYARARAIYTEVQQQWPDTAEGQQAAQRLKDLSQL